MIKKALSMILSLTLLMSLIVVPARAEGAQDEAQTVTLRMEPQSGEWKHTEYKGADPNTYYTVKIFADSELDTFIMNNAQIYFAYDTKVVSLRYAQMSSAEALAKIYDEDAGEMVSSPISMSYDKDAANKAGYATLVFTEGSGKNHVVPKGTLLATLRFTVNDGVESCAPQFAFKADNNLTILGARGIEHTVDDSATATVSISGIAPVLDRITVTDAGGKIVLDSKAQNQSHKVEINGTTDYTYQAHAYSKMGTDITSSVTWTIGTVASNNGTVITTGGANAGQIVVAKNAMPISAAVEAKLDNVTANAGNFVVGRTQKSKDTITSLSISCANTILTVPTGDKTETATFSVEAKNIYGEIILNPLIVWKIADSSGGNLASNSNSGVTLTRGVLTLTSKTKSYTGNYTVYAYTNTVESNKIPVTIKLADPEATELEIDANATTTFAIPKADKTGHGKEQTFDLPTVTVKDQYGRDVENPTLTWQTMGSTESSGMIHVVYPGIKIENGKLVVTSEAAKPEFFPEGKNEYQVPIRVSCDEKFADFTVTVTREARKAASITVSGGPTAMLLVPASGESNVTSDKPFTAVVKDQYGHTIEGASVTWSAMMGSAAMTPVAGVSMTENGCVTVSSAAAEKVLDTNGVTFTAIAKFGDDVVYGYKNFTVARAASVAASITVTGASSTVDIPGSVSYDLNGNFNGPEKDNTVSFSVAVKDQYGADKAAPDVIWSIAPEISGVSISANGVLTVKSDAAKSIDTSQEFIVTATSKTDSNIKDETTVTVQRGTPKFSGFNLYQILADGKETKLANGMSAHILSVTATPMTVKYQAKPCDQYGNNLAENVIPAGLTYAVKMSKSASIGGYDLLPDDQYTVGDQTNPGVLTIGETKPAAGDYLIQVSCSETGNIMYSRYYVKLMRKADAGLKVTKPGGGYVSDTLELAYGDVMDKLSITVDKTSGSYGVKWLSSDPSVLSITNSTGTTPTLTARKPGTATVTVTYEDSENYGSKTFTVNVSKRVLTVTEGSFKISKVYDGNTNVPGFTGDFAVSNRLEKDSVNIACNSYPAYPSANVGNYTNELTLTLSGKDADNYTLKSDKVSVPYEITPATLTIASATATDRGYVAGKTDVEISGVTFTNTSGTTVVPAAGDYTAKGEMADANADENKPVTVTVTMKNANFTLEGSTFGTKVNIAKAAHDNIRTEMSAKYGNTATLNLKALNLPEGYTFGTIDTTDNDTIFADAPAIEGNTLSVKLAAAQAKVGETGTITIPVSSTNYQNFNLIVTVTVLDKTAQTLTAEAINTVYGESFTPNVSGAKTDLTYKVKSGSIEYKNGKFTATGIGAATIVVTAAETEEYASAALEIQVNIAKRTLTVKAADKSAYVGEKQPKLTYEVSGLVGSDKLMKEPTLKLVHEAEADPMKTAGEYVITFDQAPAADAAKYDLVTADGKLTVSVRPVYIPPVGSSVEVERTQNGSIILSTYQAPKGTTVVITAAPNRDQELKSLAVFDRSGNSLPLTDLGNGKFSFVMPDGKVTVKSEFGAVSAYVNPYADVQTNDWYFGAVQYVTENGLMNGTGNGFEPNLATSRAMIWTILARMSGVNTASGGEWYAVAQQWAKANGVSDGTMPNGTITREQLAAMLYRYAVSKGMVKGPATADLSVFADANSVSSYAVEAMQWAVSTGLINGMDGKLNPQGSATRAQVATMLMRFAELIK